MTLGTLGSLSIASGIDFLEDLDGGVGEASNTGTVDGSGLEGTLHTGCLSEQDFSMSGDCCGWWRITLWLCLAGFTCIATLVGGESDLAVLSFGCKPSRIQRLRCPRKDPMLLLVPNFFSHRATLFFQDVLDLFTARNVVCKEEYFILDGIRIHFD